MVRTITNYEQETREHDSVISLKHKASKKASKGNYTRMTAKGLQNKPQQAVESLKGMVIGQDWRVGADSLNIILYRCQVNKKTGKEYWRAHSYYATVANALVGLVNQGVKDTELVDLKIICESVITPD